MFGKCKELKKAESLLKRRERERERERERDRKRKAYGN
jgi:hypothetical protein